MPERSAIVASHVGLHSRPAMLLTKAAAQSPVPVVIRRTDGPAVDATSILSVMGLGVAHGEEVVLECTDQQVLDELAELLETDLDA